MLEKHCFRISLYYVNRPEEVKRYLKTCLLLLNKMLINYKNNVQRKQDNFTDNIPLSVDINVLNALRGNKPDVIRNTDH